MPGYASWKTLYAAEFAQLAEEGYQIERPTGWVEDQPLPLPAGLLAATDVASDEAHWERAYHALWQVREQGLRPDYPYREPSDLSGILAAAGDVPALVPLTNSTYADRVRGGWFGRSAGCVLGKPLEMGLDRTHIQEYLTSVDAYPLDDWVPIRSEKLDRTLRLDCLPSSRGQVAYVQPDDDIHYSIMSLLLVEQKGLEFTTTDVGTNLLDNIPYHWLWAAHRQAYYHLVNITDDRPAAEQIDEIPLKLNPWRESIDGQLKGDLWGYISPGDPRATAPLIHRQASLCLTKNGIYGGMFVAGCLAAALSERPTVDVILQGGLSVIPRTSRLAEMVGLVTAWYAETGDWVATCQRIEERYGHLYYAATVNNMAMVVLALLHGQLDFTRSITTAVMAGIDVDCNGATVGSIVGAAIGYDQLDSRWIEPLNDTVRTVVAGFGEGTISDLAERTIALHQRHLATTSNHP